MIDYETFINSFDHITPEEKQLVDQRFHDWKKTLILKGIPLPYQFFAYIDKENSLAIHNAAK